MRFSFRYPFSAIEILRFFVDSFQFSFKPCQPICQFINSRVLLTAYTQLTLKKLNEIVLHWLNLKLLMQLNNKQSSEPIFNPSAFLNNSSFVVYPKVENLYKSGKK